MTAALRRLDVRHTGRTHGERADVEYVRVLRLAVTTGRGLV